MQNARPIDRSYGFTLAEVVVVSLLLAIVSSVIYTSLSSIMRSKETIDTRRESARTARFVLTRMSNELRSSVSESLEFETGLENQQPEPVSATNKRVSFLGINSGEGTKAKDSIHFIALNSQQPVFGAIGNYGMVQISYRLEERQGQKLEIGETESYMLIREEVPALVEDKDAIKARRITYPIADNVAFLNFRYYEEGNWDDQWKDGRGRLPSAVEITLGVKGPDGSLDSFRTAVSVRPQIGRQRFFGRR